MQLRDAGMHPNSLPSPLKEKHMYCLWIPVIRRIMPPNRGRGKGYIGLSVCTWRYEHLRVAV